MHLLSPFCVLWLNLKQASTFQRIFYQFLSLYSASRISDIKYILLLFLFFFNFSRETEPLHELNFQNPRIRADFICTLKIYCVCDFTVRKFLFPSFFIVIIHEAVVNIRSLWLAFEIWSLKKNHSSLIIISNIYFIQKMGNMEYY